MGLTGLGAHSVPTSSRSAERSLAAGPRTWIKRSRDAPLETRSQIGPALTSRALVRLADLEALGGRTDGSSYEGQPAVFPHRTLRCCSFSLSDRSTRDAGGAGLRPQDRMHSKIAEFSSVSSSLTGATRLLLSPFGEKFADAEEFPAAARNNYPNSLSARCRSLGESGMIPATLTYLRPELPGYAS